jgi:hypothetical protein
MLAGVDSGYRRAPRGARILRGAPKCFEKFPTHGIFGNLTVRKISSNLRRIFLVFRGVLRFVLGGGLRGPRLGRVGGGRAWDSD